MGLYIEVPDKLKWLAENGELIEVSYFTPESICDDEFLVVIVDNGPFLAAGVAFSDRELGFILRELDDKSDDRDRAHFLVKKELLQPVCPEWNTYMRIGTQ